MCKPLLSSPHLSRVLGASLLLGVYLFVLLLGFTSRPQHTMPHAARGGTAASMHLARAQPTRTYVTAIDSEAQLPALITLAHSLMQVRDQARKQLAPFGLGCTASQSLLFALRLLVSVRSNVVSTVC